MTLYVVLAYLTASYFIGMCLLVAVRAGKFANNGPSMVASVREDGKTEQSSSVSVLDLPEMAEPLIPTVARSSDMKQSA